MQKPTYEQGLQLHSNFLDLMKAVDHDEAQRLIQNFNLVHSIARGEIKRTVPVLLTPIVSGVSIPAAPAVKIADCFKVGDGVFAYRDPDFDRWLPETVPAVSLGNASMFELAGELNFKEMVEAAFGTKNSLDELKKTFIKQKKCWGSKQIDELIRTCERGENPLRLLTDGHANIFFIEVSDNVFAVRAIRDSDGWCVGVLGFAGADRWGVGRRVSFHN